jgi:hypothetical protein
VLACAWFDEFHMGTPGMMTHLHWHVVWDEAIEDRPLRIEREDSRSFYRVRARQIVLDVGIAYQDGDNYVHVTPSSVGETVDGEASSLDALREALREMHFSEAAVDRVMRGIGDA